MFVLSPQLEADTIFIGDLKLCRLLLSRDANYPWCILVPRREDITEIHHLNELDQQQLLKESSRLSKVMSDVFSADKMNVAALGNVVLQLHVHHVVRYHTDPSWPAPIWGKLPPKNYTDSEIELRVAQIKGNLEFEVA